MKVKIVERKNNPYLKRDELVIEIDHTGECTPSKAALQQWLSKELGKDVEKIDIRNIFSSKGSPISRSHVFLWEENKVNDLSKVVKEEKENKK
ncbi:MAG: hypothetical protein QXD48_00650 [Candidatus Aenigmatarchaeota archaeon]